MPATVQAAQVTDLYRRSLASTRDTAAEAVAALTAQVDLDASPASIRRQLSTLQARSTGLVAAAGDQAGELSLAYVRAYVLAGGAEAVAAGEVVPASTVALATVGPALLWRLASRAGRGPAVGYATAVARQAARTSVGDAARATVAGAIAGEPAVTGWRQVTGSGTCARCARAAGQLFGDAQQLRRHHPACRCSAEPVLRGITDQVRRAAPTVVSP